MKTSLDCIPCLMRQALDAARLTTADPAVHERILRDVLRWAVDMDLNQPAPVMAQRIHRQLRAITGNEDPYRGVKDHQNTMALALTTDLRAKIGSAADPRLAALRLAIAGNVIDLGVDGSVTETRVRDSIERALQTPLEADWNGFCKKVDTARQILYLADNAGEIAFDRLFIEMLRPTRVTVAVRGAPVINDATRRDAQAVGLHEIVDVIDNGSDAPGTLLDDCSPEFKERFAAADLIIAKGQGNYETLSDASYPVVFLFQAKCPVIAAHARVPMGTHVLTYARGDIPPPRLI